MDKKLDCEIVRDLLPSYVDGLTSAATNRAVEEHLGDCPDCAAALERMRAPEPEKKAPAPEVDYLKKLRRRSKSITLLVSIGLMLLAIALLMFRYLYVGAKAEPGDVSCAATVSGNTVSVSGTLTSSGLGVARVVFSEGGGIVNMTVYTALKTPFNSGDFTAEYTADARVGAVRYDEYFLWEGGVGISSAAARVYAAQSPFVGDMPANGDVAKALNLQAVFGNFTNELHTSSEPYGWTLTLEEGIPAESETEARALMRADSAVMLAVIDNLGYVTWNYSTEAGGQTYTITAEDASDLAGQDIKTCAASPSELQKLMDGTNVRWTA